MRYLLITLSILMCLSVFTACKNSVPIQSNDTVQSVDALSSQILYSLKKSSYNEYDRLLVPQDLFLDYMRMTNDFDEEQAKNKDLVGAAYTFFKTQGERNFSKLNNEMKSYNINWDEAKYVSADKGDNSTEYKLTFKDDKGAYLFIAKACAQIKGDFYLGNVNSIEKVSL